MSVAEASKVLQVSTKTVTRWCQSGAIPAFPIQFGKKITYKLSEDAVFLKLQEYLHQSSHAQEREAQTKQLEASTRQRLEQITNRYDAIVGSFDASTDSSITNHKTQHTHSECIDAWQKAMEAASNSHRTIGDYRSYIKRFFNAYAVLDFQNLEAFVYAIPEKNNETRVKAYKALLSFANYLDLHGNIDPDFIAKATNKRFRPKSKGPKKQDSVTEQEFKQILRVCETLNERFLISLLWYTGLRASEACNLKREHIFSKEKYLTTKGKGDKTRVVPIVKPLRGILYEYYKSLPPCKRKSYLLYDDLGKPMTRSGIYQRVVRIAEKAGINTHPHAFRSGLATYLINEGCPDGVVKDLLGHSSFKTTLIYHRTKRENLISQVEKFF